MVQKERQSEPEKITAATNILSFNICFMLSAAAGQFTAGSAPLGILSGMALCPQLQLISQCLMTVMISS